MKEIIINKIRLLNFKGVRDLTLDFKSKNCDINADNGLGKSSIFDAFTWVLFGKDRKGREKFALKTFDENNKIIPRIPHEVEISMTIDGQNVKLCRRFVENWVKKRGSATEEFKGNVTEYMFNDVPCNGEEWESKIAEICSENVFRAVTNPMFFTSLNTQSQKKFLFEMAGGVDDQDVAAGNIEFETLLANMTGKTIEDYKKEVAAKKSAITKQLKELPGEIKGKRRDISLHPDEDWSALEAERDRLKERRNELDRQMHDVSESQLAHNRKLASKLKEISDIKSLISTRTFEVKEEVSAEYRKLLSERNELISRRDSLSRGLTDIMKQITIHQNEADACTRRRETLIAEYKILLQKKASYINERDNTEPKLSENDFRCPTCGHQYDIDRIEEISANAKNAHRAKYDRLLSDIADSIEANQKKGRANNATKDEHLARVEELKLMSAGQEEVIAELDNNTLVKNTPVAPDTTPALASDEKLTQLIATLSALETEYNEMQSQPEISDNEDLKKESLSILDQLDEITVRLSKRADIKKDNDRLAELESQFSTMSQELAQLEGIEFTIQSFSKAKIEAIENRINSLFKIVKFRMFVPQLNGGEKETCEAMVDGVPFSDLNDAGRINAGLDIINALCRHYQISAPIFIDNAESINRPLETISQRIRLIVSKDNKITLTENPE